MSCLVRLIIFLILLNVAVYGAKRPNILWIFSEDLSPFLGCYDDPVNMGHTPTIDNMAREGVVFKRAFATAPVCSASRSAIITGVFANKIGAHQHRSSRAPEGTIVPEHERINLPDGIKTIPELMREAGYFTFNSGKDDYNFHYNRRVLYSVGTKGDYKVGMNGWQGNTATHKLSITEDTWNARSNKKQPWFGQIMLMGGKELKNKYIREGELLKHGDVPLPPYFPDSPAFHQAWTGHYNANRNADARVQMILDQLEADGELDHTIIFFFSDHGSNTSLRHKQFCYEGGLHIPLVIMGRHPLIKPGTMRDELVSALDISATTLVFAEAVLPDYLDGQNLFGDDYQAVDYIIGARDRCDYTIDRIRSVRSDHFRYIKNDFPERHMLQAQYRDKHQTVVDLKTLREEGKLTAYQELHWFGERPKEELYDLDKDPHQINNLVGQAGYGSILMMHRDVLSEWEQHSDLGEYPEPSEQLQGTYELWKDRPIFREADVNPEYDQFR